MRYYLVKITFNKVAQAEDRPQPTGYDTLDEALKALHSYMYQNILGETIGWCQGLIINSNAGVERVERWEENTNPDDLVARIKSGELDYYTVISQYPQYKDYIDEKLNENAEVATEE